MAGRAVKHDWVAITTQFMASDFHEFGAFLRHFKMPPHLARSPEGRGLTEKKRGVIKRIENRVVENMLADPIRQREEKRTKVLADLEKLGERLRSAVMARLNADAVMVSAQEGEAPQAWASRITDLQKTDKLLNPSDIMALAGAARVADDIVRKAAGLVDFDWDAHDRNQKLTQKGRKALEIEIIKTSNARPLDALPYAEEEKKKA